MTSVRKMLEVVDIDTFYGLSHVLFRLTLEIHEGEILCLLGRNGSGKTTAIRSIAGFTPPRSGSIHFLGEDITKLSAHMIARRGIMCAFSEKRIFGDLTVRENLEIGKRTPASGGAVEIWGFDRVFDLFPVLKRYQTRWARTLSGGEQQMLCIARALMANPKLLLLDEPTIGLAPVIVNTIGEHIVRLKDEGISILLTEQNVKFAMAIGNRCSIIDVGEIKFQGTFDELSKNEYVLQKYLAV